MWPFTRKSSSKADAALAIMDEVVEIAAIKWKQFIHTMPFKADVPLVDRIAAFQIPFEEGLFENRPEFRRGGSGFALLITAYGIEASGTHSRPEIEQALGLTMPRR